MTFSPSARPQQATGTKKHQMRVTHSALGLHAGQPPERSEGHRVVQPGLAPRNKTEGDASRRKWRQSNPLGTNGAAYAGKGTEYAQSERTVPLARDFAEGGSLYRGGRKGWNFALCVPPNPLSPAA